MQTTTLVEYILAHPGATPARVSAHLDVSVRTVRTYVRQANDAMAGFASIELPRGGGYRVTTTDRDRLDAWLAPAGATASIDIPQTPRQRTTYLLNDLLMRDDWVTLEDLARILFVSRSAVSGDLKYVERTLARFGLALQKRPHYGIRVSGPEMARRVCLANSVMASYEGTSGGGVLAESDLLAHVTSCVDAVISEADYQINSVAYQNLLVHISVAIMRIRENCYVPMESEHLRGIKGSREYPMARAIAERIDHDLDVNLPEEEIAYIAIHLAGKQTLSIDVDDQGLVISDEVWAVVSEMLDCVWNVFRFDFRNDLELRMNLARHIVPLAVRLRYNMRLKNPLLADIRRRYPLAYSMACDASSVLAEHYDAKLSDDETGYIALAFALALEHQKTDAPRKNVLMVCASGAGSARLLEYRCRQEFGDFVGEITTCDVLDLGKVDFDRIDYVFTTVPLNRTLPVPVREVRHFLDPSDIEGVRDLFRVEKREDEDISRYFDRALFFPHLGLATKREVLDFLIKRVAEHRDVASNFAELVWKREATVATSFGNGVAMPHPLEPASEETFVCVAVLEEPVEWDEFGREVRVVFLSSFSASEGLELQRFYSTLADMLVSRHAMATLEEGQSWDTLMALLATFSQTAHATKNNPGGRPTFDSAMDGTDAMGSQKEQGR